MRSHVMQGRVGAFICFTHIGLALASSSMPKFTPSKETANLPYRNVSLCINDRVDDLLSRMTIEEKAGQMFQTLLLSGPNGTLEQATPEMNSSDYMITTQLMTHFNLAIQIEDPKAAAEFTNRVQARALETRLGIPVTISTDPRHAFTDDIRTGFQAVGFSQWPETLGLAAIRSADLVRKFAEIAREEYLAVGIRAALHPQVDLATEPRWPRNRNGFGENATLTAELLTAYIKGFQGDTFGHQSVSTVTKHFPGAGSASKGHDAHNRFGMNSTYPGHNFDYHLIPFKAAIKAGARQMMPYYSRPVGTEYDAVGFSFNKAIVTGLLREKLGFEGVVLTDWGLITNTVVQGKPWVAKAWGVEYLSELERAARVINAGCDQFGGEARPELVVELVKKGIISESRVNQSVRKLLREKFLLGLFDHPFVDPEQSKLIVGNPYFRRVGLETQRKYYTLLTNKNNILPLRHLSKKAKFYVEGFNSSLIKARGFQVTSNPHQADFAILRLKAPSAPADPIELGTDLESGSLEYTSKEKQRQAKIFRAVPTIVDINFNRPAAVPEVAAEAKALFASYGSSTDAFLDDVFSVDGAEPEGKLPFDLPRSNAAVAESFEDVPFDTKDPVFRFGHGLSYKGMCE
ncbi:glycosyl hydrolase family 3 N terminal domain-containing protein [Fusarium tricinctum]|uniref:beta-glucosidase n=1 Tax=Fusarium tricinctum TaxID=61284 RepID=A0A8K0RP84_9HYPO|nr:glycosyl hydrolase family 3 N terminal domain-containing protein [Fusarium tricinctum]